MARHDRIILHNACERTRGDAMHRVAPIEATVLPHESGLSRLMTNHRCAHGTKMGSTDTIIISASAGSFVFVSKSAEDLVVDI